VEGSAALPAPRITEEGKISRSISRLSGCQRKRKERRSAFSKGKVPSPFACTEEQKKEERSSCSEGGKVRSPRPVCCVRLEKNAKRKKKNRRQCGDREKGENCRPVAGRSCCASGGVSKPVAEKKTATISGWIEGGRRGKEEGNRSRAHCVRGEKEKRLVGVRKTVRNKPAEIGHQKKKKAQSAISCRRQCGWKKLALWERKNFGEGSSLTEGERVTARSPEEGEFCIPVAS